mmetsp:Transcript_35733/g.78237  ORF Transcript_35733/g.78237 Transcript_35733/m.78237 type:complete len:212 (+) Transcript_35733:1292-1927(+)
MHDAVDVPANGDKRQVGQREAHDWKSRYLCCMHAGDRGHQHSESQQGEGQTAAEFLPHLHTEAAVGHQNVFELLPQVVGWTLQTRLLEVGHLHHRGKGLLRLVHSQESAERTPALPHIVDQQLGPSFHRPVLQSGPHVGVVHTVTSSGSRFIDSAPIQCLCSKSCSPSETKDLAELVVRGDQEALDGSHNGAMAKRRSRQAVVHERLGPKH